MIDVTIVCEGIASLIILTAICRRAATFTRAKSQLRAHHGGRLSMSPGSVVLVPIRGEPLMAVESASWWSTCGALDVRFVVTDAEVPARTREALESVDRF